MNVKTPLIFLAGSSIGALAGVLGVKKYYENLANKEIEEIRNGYNQKLSEMSTRNRNKDIDELMETVRLKVVPEEDGKKDYTKYRTETKEEPTEVVTRSDISEGPVLHSIEQDDFIAMDGYEKETVVVYKDGVAALDDGSYARLEIADTIGEDAIERIYQQTGSAIYIRNETELTDYEVVYDDHTYTQVTGIPVME